MTTSATSNPACIGSERAPAEANSLTVRCPRKASRECCGHRFCAEHYRQHRAGVHPPKWERRRQR